MHRVRPLYRPVGRDPLYRFMAGCLLAVAAAACGGGSGDGGKPPTAPPPPARVLTTVTVSLSAATIQVGQTATATAAGLDQNGAAIATGAVSWSTGSPSIATVSEAGVVSGVAPGQVSIVATAGGRSGQASLTVIPVPVATVSVTPAAVTLAIGATQQFAASALGASGQTLTGRAVTWASSDSTVARLSTSNGLVSALATGSATITATSEGKSGTATVTVLPPPVASVSISAASASTSVNGTVALTATAFDATGNVLTGRTFAWTSSNPSVVSGTFVSNVFTAQGVAPGTATITATSENKSGSALVTVTLGAALSITSITPAVLVEGSAAAITGTGFTPAATVTIAGLAASVTSSSSTQLQVTVPARDCQPQRTETVVVRVAGTSAAAQATVKGADPISLGANFFVWSGTDQCISLAAGPAGARYVVGMLSTSDVPSQLTVSQLLTSIGTASAVASTAVGGATTAQLAELPSAGFSRFLVPGALMPIGEPLPKNERNWRAEARVRESEARLLSTLDKGAARRWLSQRVSASRMNAFAQAPLAVGDTTTLRVGNFNSISCAQATTVRAVVRYVGSDNIWLEDIANPTVAFSTTEYQSMEAFFVANTKPTLAAFAGTATDVDNNQHSLILISKEVNKVGNLLGLVWGGDLYPPAQCATSNGAEIFYGLAPDPAGVYGDVWTKTAVSTEYRALMAHELTHVIQLGKQIYFGAGQKATWELEGGATLSEQLVGFRVYGYASGQNLGLTQLRADTEYFQKWVLDLATYFGFSSATTRTTGAPEQCTWVGRPSEGNSGPCANAIRAVYGVPATLLRFVLDRYGAAYPGGETALMRNIVGSPNAGYGSLTVPTGVSTSELLTRFGLMLWSDGKTSNSLASWNLLDIFSGFVASAQLSPYTSSSLQPSLQAAVRAGSTAFLEWSPTAATTPTSLRVRSPSGGAVPSTMVLWVYRYQ